MEQKRIMQKGKYTAPLQLYYLIIIRNMKMSRQFFLSIFMAALVWLELALGKG